MIVFPGKVHYMHYMHLFFFTMLSVSEKILLGMCNSSNVQAWEFF
jgi:hypothetical protein